METFLSDYKQIVAAVIAGIFAIVAAYIRRDKTGEKAGAGIPVLSLLCLPFVYLLLGLGLLAVEFFKLPMGEEKGAAFKLTSTALTALRNDGVPRDVLAKLDSLKDKDYQRDAFQDELSRALDRDERDRFQSRIMVQAEKSPEFQLSDKGLQELRSEGVPEDVLNKLGSLQGKDMKREAFLKELGRTLNKDERDRFQDRIVSQAEQGHWHLSNPGEILALTGCVFVVAGLVWLPTNLTRLLFWPRPRDPAADVVVSPPDPAPPVPPVTSPNVHRGKKA
jgi:hypothetical protein